MYKLWIWSILALCLSASAFATVGDVAYSVSFTCTGTTGPFPFTFPISDPTALTVTMNDAFVPSANYTVVPINANYTNGGTVTMGATCQAGWTLILARSTPITQNTQFYDNMPVPMKTFEKAVDKLTEIDQEIWGETLHSIQFQNNGANVGEPMQHNGVLNVVGCFVTGATDNFILTCNNGGGASSAINIVDPTQEPYNCLCNSVSDDSACLQVAINATESFTANNSPSRLASPQGRTCVFGSDLLVNQSGTDSIDIGGFSGPGVAKGSGMRWTSINGAGIIINPSVIGEGIGTNLHDFALDCSHDGIPTDICPAMIQIGTPSGTNSSTFGPINVYNMTINGHHEASVDEGSYGAVSAIKCGKSCGIQINVHDNNLENFSGPIVDFQAGGQNITIANNQFFDAPKGVAISASGPVKISDNYFEMFDHAIEINNTAYWNFGMYDIGHNFFDLNLSPPRLNPTNSATKRSVYITNQTTASNVTAKVSLHDNLFNQSDGFVSGGVGLAPWCVEIDLAASPNGIIIMNAENNKCAGVTTAGIHATSASDSLTYINDFNNETTALYRPDDQGITYLLNVDGDYRVIPYNGLNIAALGPATALANKGSYDMLFLGSYWTAGTPTLALWDISFKLGSGTTPTSTLLFSPSSTGGGFASIAVPAITSTTANRADTCFICMASGATEVGDGRIAWRNDANDGNLPLAPDTDDSLAYVLHPFITSAGVLDAGILGATSGVPPYSALGGGGTGTGANCLSDTVPLTWVTCGGGGGGSGTVSSGTATHLGGYLSNGTTISDLGADFTFLLHTMTGGASSILDLHSAATSGLLVPGGLSGFLKATPGTGALTSVTSVPLSSLSTQAANTIVMNATGGSAVPTAVLAPSGGTNGCAGASDASTYNTSTHLWGCNTITGTVPASTTPKILGYGAANTPTATQFPIYSGELMGLVGDNSTDNCSAMTTAVTGALAIVSAVGPAYLQLPIGNLTKLTTCDLAIPANVIILGSGNNGALKASTAPKSGLHIARVGGGTDPMITCYARGLCGFKDMYIKNDVNNRPFLKYTCGVPWLDNVEFEGETAAVNGSNTQWCADGSHACPDNDGIAFGTLGATGSTCAAGDGFDGYGNHRMNNLYFRNMRQWMAFYDNANGMTATNVWGDYTDADPTEAPIKFNGTTNAATSNTLTGISVEIAPNGTVLCNYAKGAFDLASKGSGNILQANTPDIGGCPYAYTASATSSVNIITINGSAPTIACGNDASNNQSNTSMCMNQRTFSVRNILTQNIGAAGGVTSGIDTLFVDNGRSICFNQGSVPYACDMGLSRGGTGGYLKVGNGTAGDSSGIIATGAIRAGGTAATLAGTGACATRTGQVGGASAGQVQCTAVGGTPATLTITPGVTAAPNGYFCSVQDTTTAGVGSVTTRSATAPVVTLTNVIQNDILIFSCVQY